MAGKRSDHRGAKGWLYLLPALLFLGVFMIYPLFDVFVYSFEEGYHSASQTYFGTGSEEYAAVGGHYGSAVHRNCIVDFVGAALHYPS